MRKGEGRKEYQAWIDMRRRCNDPSNKSYVHYGARGITVCAAWSLSFETFYLDMGKCPRGLTLERIDVNGNYEPSNCCWATPKDQTRNRRISLSVTMNGETRPLIEWCEVLGVPYWLVVRRIRKFKWEATRALTTPSLGRGGGDNTKGAAASAAAGRKS